MPLQVGSWASACGLLKQSVFGTTWTTQLIYRTCYFRARTSYDWPVAVAGIHAEKENLSSGRDGRPRHPLAPELRGFRSGQVGAGPDRSRRVPPVEPPFGRWWWRGATVAVGPPPATGDARKSAARAFAFVRCGARLAAVFFPLPRWDWVWEVTTRWASPVITDSDGVGVGGERAGQREVFERRW